MPSREPGVSLDVLREAVRLRAADTSLRQVARETGVSHQTLQRFVEGTEPYSATAAKLREWYEREKNEVLRLRQEVATLKKRLAECERKLRQRNPQER